MEIGAGLQTARGEGWYADVLTDMLRDSGQQYDYRVYPFRRAVRIFFEREADCIWALDSKLLREFGGKDSDLTDSEVLFVSKQYIFMASGVPAISDIAELAGKKLGILNGSNLPDLLGGLSVDFVHVADQDTKVRMLVNNRLDAIGGWVPEILVAFRNQGAAPTSFNPAIVLASSNVGIVCHTSPRTLSFLNAANPSIKGFAKSNRLQELNKMYNVQIQ